MTFDQARAFPYDAIAHVDDGVARPVLLEVRHDLPIAPRVEPALVTSPLESGASLDIGDDRCHDQISLGDGVATARRAVLVDIDLHERAGVEVEPHRRSSMTACATDG